MRFGGIVLIVLVTLGACSSEPSPRVPSPTPTSATPTPTATVPTMPPQATEDSPEGAAAFVKHYIDVFNYASNTGDVEDTGDVEELSQLSSSKCEGCQRYIKLYRETYAAGGYFTESDWKLSHYEVEGESVHASVYAHVSAPHGRYKTSASSESKTGSGEDTELIFKLIQGVQPKMISFERRV